MAVRHAIADDLEPADEPHLNDGELAWERAALTILDRWLPWLPAWLAASGWAR